MEIKKHSKWPSSLLKFATIQAHLRGHFSRFVDSTSAASITQSYKRRCRTHIYYLVSTFEGIGHISDGFVTPHTWPVQLSALGAPKWLQRCVFEATRGPYIVGHYFAKNYQF